METRDQTGQNTAEPDPFDPPRQHPAGSDGPRDAAPADAVPGHAAPGDAVPRGAVPENTAPQEAVPEVFAPARAGTAVRMIRTSDAERDEALRSLATHYAAGRLETAEFDTRADDALAARTRADLRRLFADLPGGPPTALLDVPPEDRAARYPRSGLRSAGRPSPYQRSDRRPYRSGFGGPPALGRRLTVLAAVLLMAALGAARHGYFPFPLIPALFILSRRPWRWN